MRHFKVRRFDEQAKWDGKVLDVDAASEQEAAEKTCGPGLKEAGGELRAQVWEVGAPQSRKMFYSQN